MTKVLRIALGADHRGFELKEDLAKYLGSLAHTVLDCGVSSPEPVDYPRIALAVATLVGSGECDFGIMIDGSGIGSAMAANKVPGVLAAPCHTEELARSSREHNDANLLTLGASQITAAEARSIVRVFLSTQCGEERHLARLKIIRDFERERAAGQGEPSHLEISGEDITRIAGRVRELLGTAGNRRPSLPVILPDQLAKLIDHTLLRPEATTADIERLCDEARRFGFVSVCVNPSYVRPAVEQLRGTAVKVCAVVGFPLGAQTPEIKALEARRALREGAREIDMVINVGALKSQDDRLVLRDIRGVVEICQESRAVSKVILETALLTDDEKVRGCQLAMRARADFVKTSTGFSSGGATPEDVALMSRVVTPRKLGVKAAGGIRTYADVVKMIEAGATRVGCSSSVKIMAEAQALARGGSVDG